MKRKNRYISIVLFIAILLCSCTKKPKPEDTIYKLEKAFNNYDIDMMLECYEPSVQAIYEGIAEIGGNLLGGIDLKTMMSTAGGIANIFGDELIEGGLPEIDININSQEEVTDEKVQMDLTINYIYSNEMLDSLPEDMSTEQNIDIYLVLIDDTWYISAETPIN